ncbi:hypothetical protein CHS0354_030339 [Potamilus streckersoni]|uniref:CUB domain-containing protein n=1 Tax=Potamilus streckersoni TaxID=2493646 RepID=A0AAE0W7Q1_9BIVA|nr:hypothetical protein CHS0354_030339 [Potamilus streckersoni]
MQCVDMNSQTPPESLLDTNYALVYPENQNCTWNIRVHNGYRLLLTLNVTSSLDRNISTLDCVQEGRKYGFRSSCFEVELAPPGFQPNIFRPRLFTPRLIRCFVSSAEVWESKGFEKDIYHSENVDRTKELYLSIIGENSTSAARKEVARKEVARKEVARNKYEDECINTFGSGVDGIVFTVGEDNVADTLKCPRRLDGKAFTDTDCTNNTLQNDGYITSKTLDSSSRKSTSDLDSFYFEFEVDVHHKVDD